MDSLNEELLTFMIGFLISIGIFALILAILTSVLSYLGASKALSQAPLWLYIAPFLLIYSLSRRVSSFRVLMGQLSHGSYPVSNFIRLGV